LESVRAERPDLPFVLFPETGSEEVASDAITAGVTGYLRRETGTDQYAVLARRVRRAVERHRATAEVEERRRRAETILDASPDAIVVSVDGEHVFANRAAVDLFDARDETDLVGTAVADFVPPDHRDEVLDAITEVQRDDRSIVRARRSIRTLGGESVPVEITARSIRWGGERGLVVIIRDPTDRTERERGQTRYRAAFEEAFDAMVIADDDGRYVEVNESACELFGLPKEDLLGRRISEFAPGEFDFEAAWRRFQESDDEQGTFPLVRANGERRTVEYAATTDIIPGEHLSVLRDVTERERQYETIQKQRDELDRFAGIVSHDLRNPLTTAQGYLELAREERDSEHLDRIGHGLDRMDRIIEDVLWLARQGEEIGPTDPVDLREAIEDAWLIVADQETTAKLRLADEAFGRIEADDDRLSQLLENLLRNAVEHGGSDVTVRVEPTATGVAIEDDGPGIPADERDRVFESGYSTRTDGTGFGLSIVERICEAHGWSVDVTTGDLGGARFEISGVAREPTDDRRA
ncbi:MAG: PAS domain S-box protein, partial [Haloferacaceae archaeon]